MKSRIILPALLFLLLFSCKKKDRVSQAETRSFYMGVTPWPADFTLNELDSAYSFINSHCDIASHHFDDGIPYEEAFNNLPMPANFVQDVQVRKNKTAAGKKIFLSVSALNITRIVKADYYNNAPTTDSIKNYWKQLPFDNSKMVTAYVNYMSWLIDQLKPVYVNYGVESNVLSWSPAEFAKYKIFLSQVYPLLKTKYPSLPFFISFIVDESSEGFNYASQLMPYTDWVGLSSYAHITVSSSANGNTDPKIFPAGYYEKFADLSASKPLAFAETGYTAENVIIPFYNLNKQGNAAWQKDYLEMVLKFCNERKAKLFIWFCSKDYDAGSNTLRNLGLYLEIMGFWEDTGLKDENGNKRPAFFLWEDWYKKQRVE